MVTLLPAVLLLTGLVCVVKGADFLVDGASSLAKRFSISELVIGLTIVAFGTSAPELVVNIFSSISKKNDIVLGNIIGSSIANILLILGISGIIYPLLVQKKSVWREIPFSFFAVCILFVLVSNGELKELSLFDGLILLILFIMFIGYVYHLSKGKSLDEYNVELYALPKTIIFIILGFAVLFIGGDLVVDNAVIIARQFKVSEKLISLTIISIGTSLPELATSAVAAYKKRCDIAVGNIVGSNIFNIFLVLGISAVINPVAYDSVFNIDLYVLTASSAVLFIFMFTGEKQKLDRWESLLLLISYIGYMGFIIYRK